jgi:hypothetical protein
MSGAYATASTIRKRPRPISSNKIGRGRSLQTTEPRKMKLTLKQRIRNWIMDDGDGPNYVSRDIEPDSLSSEGMRFQLYKASGGFVIETRKYDERKDEHNCKMYVITEEQDLGAELGKIITMESLR